MDFLKNLLSTLPFGKSSQKAEYFFALNIGPKNLQACVWLIEGKNLQVLNASESSYGGEQEIIKVADQLLDKVLLSLEVEPEKILFGVQTSWLMDDDLKPPFLKTLQELSKYLDLKPLAYVATSHAIANFLEQKEGAPTTGILVDIEKEDLEVTVIRAGKLDGTKLMQRSENPGQDIEKALLAFTDVEVLPSRVLLYGGKGLDFGKLKDTLLAFPWMSRLSFLHFPKIEILEGWTSVNAIALAGASELVGDVNLIEGSGEISRTSARVVPISEVDEAVKPEQEIVSESKDFGFIEGDINEIKEELKESNELETSNIRVVEKTEGVQEPVKMEQGSSAGNWLPRLGGVSIIIVLLLAAVLLLPQASITIFVEPQILEKDAQVTADPAAKTVDENKKIIPGEIVTIEVNGSDKISASGKKAVGDLAKGTVKVINNSTSAQVVSQGTVISSNSLKFTLDKAVNVASTSAIADSKSTASVNVTAVAVGPDSNLPSGSQFTLTSNSQVAIVSEGNFSGGTSKLVTVVTDEDQKKLLATLASNLRKQAKDQLQGKLKDKKILEEALSEEIIKKTYSKGIGNQASEFSLNVTIRYKGTAYSESALKSIVSKALGSQIPQGFELNLAETETSADISKLEKDGKLIFLARFKAKLSPKIDINTLKGKIRAKTPTAAIEILKKQPHIVGADIKLTPSLPAQISLLPLLNRNIKLELKLQ